MKSFGISVILVGILALILIGGCSKDKDVADLEKEMMGETTAVAAPDTTNLSPTMMADTMGKPSPDATAIPNEPEVDAMPTRPAGSGYEVQLAGCEDQAYAQYLIDLYRQRGYEPYVTTATVEGQMYYRVRLGVFQTLSEARKVRAEVIDRYSIDAWIDEG